MTTVPAHEDPRCTCERTSAGDLAQRKHVAPCPLAGKRGSNYGRQGTKKPRSNVSEEALEDLRDAMRAPKTLKYRELVRQAAERIRGGTT